jgi:cation diffusion facilitator CzcD-associated flavoprotein CzcO
VLYSFSFVHYDWSRTHATQAELQQYAEYLIDRFDIRSHFRFSTGVDEAVWNEDRGSYTVQLANGEAQEFEAVVSCVGILSHPRYPEWDSLDTFKGAKFHSARWDHDEDLAGKTVAFAGTGSTGAQVVPRLAQSAGHVYVFQRSPGWVLPKGEREFTSDERARTRGSALLRRWRRLEAYRVQKRLVAGTSRVGTKLHAQVQDKALEYIETEVHDPALRRAVTPDYPLGCKRIVLASTFYSALNRDNVTLVPHAVTRVTEDGIVGADGVERKVDVIIIGTGFQATRYLSTFDVKGYGGRSIHDVWDGDPRAVLGLTVPGFPNFFMCYGPNTNGGPGIMFMSECQARAVARVLRRLQRRAGKAIDTRQRALDQYVRWVDRQNRKWMSARFANCTNYDFAPSGRAVLLWPRSGAYYDVLTRIVPSLAMTVRR